MKKFIALFALMVITLASYAQVYKMYNTRNYHNQLRLNTMTGEVQQIQDDGQSWIVCSAREISGDKESRFRLYETQNMWTFILLDSYNGRLWQVQYSAQDLDNLFCIPINKYELVSDNENCIFSIQPLTSMYQYYLIMIEQVTCGNSNGVPRGMIIGGLKNLNSYHPLICSWFYL